MITLYGGPTPNAAKIAIAMEEMGLEWELVLIDILNGDQLTPEFLKLNPNNKTPVIIDDECEDGPLTLWESGAILWYLAEKTGQFIPKSAKGRALCHQWLIFQVSGVGPMFGQFGHFFYYLEEKHVYPIQRYGNEVERLTRVIDARLRDAPYLAGEEYSIADMAMYPFLRRRIGLNAESGAYRHIAQWAERVSARPAVQRGVAFGEELIRDETVGRGMAKPMTEETKSFLWGEKQYADKRL